MTMFPHSKEEFDQLLADHVAARIAVEPYDPEELGDLDKSQVEDLPAEVDGGFHVLHRHPDYAKFIHDDYLNDFGGGRRPPLQSRCERCYVDLDKIRDANQRPNGPPFDLCQFCEKVLTGVITYSEDKSDPNGVRSLRRTREANGAPETITKRDAKRRARRGAVILEPKGKPIKDDRWNLEF